jgi:hypothetical protein
VLEHMDFHTLEAREAHFSMLAQEEEQLRIDRRSTWQISKLAGSQQHCLPADCFSVVDDFTNLDIPATLLTEKPRPSVQAVHNHPKCLV